MKYRKILALALSCVMAFSVAACGNSGGKEEQKEDTKTEQDNAGDANAEEEGSDAADGEEAPEASGEMTDITLWTYPIGNWGDSATVDGLISSFTAANPNINVSVEYLDYTNGDDQINTAIEGGKAPDLVMEGPERLVANWGAKGLMVDLSDLWTDEAKEAIYDSVESACQNNEGVFYEYPLCMTAHTMAINRDVFEAADALQYLDEEKGTWTTEGFQKAVEAVAASGQAQVGAVYCGGQGGDQGTRALINNLYGGTFTNPEHTEYTASSEENIKALELLKGMEGINFDASIQGGGFIICHKVDKCLSCFNLGCIAVIKDTESPDTAAKLRIAAFCRERHRQNVKTDGFCIVLLLGYVPAECHCQCAVAEQVHFISALDRRVEVDSFHSL